jgi:hypothetical protein
MVEVMGVAERACGFRQVGGIYLSCALGPGGSPAENFLIDPPRPVDVEAMGLSSIGTKIIPWTTVTESPVETHYVFDIVGEDSYPNVADFIEEVRRQGLSRRIARNSDFAKLDANSRIVLVHRRGFIANSSEYHAQRPKDEKWCPKDHPKHIHPTFFEMCAALYWEDVTGGLPADHPDAPQGKLTVGQKFSTDVTGMHMHRRRSESRSVVRTMPSFSYRALCPPVGVTPIYSYAAFASFPIHAIEVIKDRAGGTHDEAIDRACKSGLRVNLVDE